MREQIRSHLEAVQRLHGKPVPVDDEVRLRDIGFRSLDFSEVCLRLEDALDRELNFDAVGVRQVLTVGDVLDAIEAMTRG